MLATGSGMLRAAQAGGYAIGAFSTYSLETTQAICQAADLRAAPAVVQAGASAFRVSGREQLAALALAAARAARAPLGVHLDHSRDLEEVQACLDRGYTSVMVDGSHLPFADNVALTLRAVAAAHAAGAWIEAELGALAGDEDVSTGVAAGTAMTDPDAARRFVEETGVDALAVAIGNVHGFTAEPVSLDFERLDAIRQATRVPLVLHGASGLPDADIRRAIQLGVCKINVNAELRRGLFDALPAAVADSAAGYDIATLMRRCVAAVARVVEEKLTLFGADGHAHTADARR